MPKMKTCKSASKRYKLTANGKLVIKKQGARHILTKKSAKRKRRLRQAGVVDSVEVKRAKKLLPYG